MLPDLNHPKSLLLIRLSAIGDIVMASGLLSAIKAKWPDCQITWLVEPVGAGLLRGHPLLADVIELPRTKWKTLRKQGRFLSLFSSISQTRTELRKQHFDVILDTQGLLKSGIWAGIAKGKRKIGLGSKEGSAVFFDYVLPRDVTPVISSEYLELARQIGCDSLQFSMSLANSEQDRHTVTSFLLKHNIQQYAVFCVYTTRPQKHWFDDYWQALAKQIEQQFGIPAIVVGGPADVKRAEKLVSGGNMYNAAGQTSLTATAELVRRAQFVVGVDTGVTHMGIMHKVPTVCIFGSTAPYLQADGAEIIYLNKACSPCRRKPTCNGSFDCMSDISPEMVMQTLRQLLTEQDQSKS